MNASHNGFGGPFEGWGIPGFSTMGELGAGATGRVVVAVEQATGRRVAIKYLVPHLVGDQTFVQRFRAEARLLSLVQDPHVVQLYGYVEADGSAAIVMELVDGTALSRLIAEHGPTSPEAALYVLRGSLSGLGAAHRLGVVHRDYKPANILVRPDGVSMLSDFGVAAAGGAQAGVAGTPVYMAPEQWHGSVGTPSDVYAATVVFFECLTGHVPFTGSTLPEIATAHAFARIPVEEVPEPLRGLLAYGMAKDPAERPLTAELFAEDLERVAVAAYGPDWAERGRRALGALVGVTAVAMLLGSASGGSGSVGATASGASTVGGSSFVTSTLGVTVLTIAGLAVIAGGVAIAVDAANTSRPAHRITHAAPQPPPAPIIIPSSVSPSITAQPTPTSDTTSAAPPPQPPPPPPTTPDTTTTSPTLTTTATLTITPTSVAAGDSISVHVSGFQPGEVVTFSNTTNSANVTTTGSTTVGSTGSSTLDLPVHSDVPAGTYTITATGETSGRTAQTHLTVTAPALNPSLSLSPGTLPKGTTPTPRRSPASSRTRT